MAKYYITLTRNDGHNEAITLSDPETGKPRAFDTEGEAIEERDRKAAIFTDVVYTVVKGA